MKTPARRVGRCPDLVAEGILLRRLLDALAGRVEAPAVIKAADRVALDPARHQRHVAMHAARRHDLRATTLAAINDEILAEDPQRLDVADLEIGRVIDRMPETAHVAAIQRARSDPFDIGERNLDPGPRSTRRPGIGVWTVRKILIGHHSLPGQKTGPPWNTSQNRCAWKLRERGRTSPISIVETPHIHIHMVRVSDSVSPAPDLETRFHFPVHSRMRPCPPENNSLFRVG